MKSLSGDPHIVRAGCLDFLCKIRILGWSSLQILVLLLWVGFVSCENFGHSHKHGRLTTGKTPQTHSCIHDRILEQQRRSGVNQYKYTPQVKSCDSHKRAFYSRNGSVWNCKNRNSNPTHMDEPLQAFRVTFFSLTLRRCGYYCKR